jgi:urease accessory protein UreG
MPVVPAPTRTRATLAPAAAVGHVAPGAGRLEFTRVGGRTVLTRVLSCSPLKLLHPRQANRSASVYLSTYGGGLVGGDHLDLSLTVGPGAAALVATQASTKVYRSPLGASQKLCAEVADQALLVLLPDPVTCFAGATYSQDQRIRLDPGASLVLVDRVTAGRVEHGERWDISHNLVALEELMDACRPDLLFVESGGDNLAAQFSRELVDYTIYVIDVSGGDKIPRKGGPGITQSDLLVVNKTDLAALVGADLDVMARDARTMRGDGPVIFAQVIHGTGVPPIVEHVVGAWQRALSAAV